MRNCMDDECTHFPDSSLCTFYRAGLNIATKAQLFADYMESSLTAEDDTSPTQDPEPSQPAPRHAEFEPEPTADDEPEPRATELKIATEPEPYTSDQVREPATSTMTGECNMEQVRAMESPAHCTTAGGELDDNSGDLIDFSTEDLENNSGDLIDFFTEVSTCHVMPASMESPPTLPLLPMSTSVCSPLSPDSPSAHPQPTTCAVGSPRVCQLPSASGLEDPSSPPPASESRTPPRPSDPAAPPRLSAPSSPSSPIGPPAPPGSLVFPAPPWSVVGPSSPQDSIPPAAPRHSVPPALWTSSLPLAQPPSSVAPAPPRTFGSPPTPRSPEPRAPPWPSGSSVSPWIFGSPSPPRAPPPAAPPPSVAPLESSAFSPPWLLPPSAPPWVVMMAVVWVSHGSSCSGSLLSSPWLLPPSSPPWTLFIVLLPEDRPPPEPPPTMTLLFPLPFHAASNVRVLCAVWTVYVCFSHCAHIWFFLPLEVLTLTHTRAALTLIIIILMSAADKMRAAGAALHFLSVFLLEKCSRLSPHLLWEENERESVCVSTSSFPLL
ncbi:hypothetical protein M9458_007583 [Cirrhinus mrigala]|uniref:Uncharacterized protein n=1 Tax=Cirrhinus mrigala TaxID=683832 RepID=A0ABD0RKH3_CIRMR